MWRRGWLRIIICQRMEGSYKVGGVDVYSGEQNMARYSSRYFP